MQNLILKQFAWKLDVEKFRAIRFSIAKTHILLVDKETSDVLSSNIVRND